MTPNVHPLPDRRIRDESSLSPWQHGNVKPAKDGDYLRAFDEGEAITEFRNGEWLRDGFFRSDIQDAQWRGIVPKGHRRVGFWCDGKQFEVVCIDAPTLTADGMQLKTATNTGGWYQLFLERDDNVDGDLAIGDSQAVVLNADGSTKLYAVPPTVAA